jgi:hypothetical protein
MSTPAAAARNAIALLPRSLRISPSTPITNQHLVAIYREQLRIANSFSSYNFKAYFVRKTKAKFRTELPSLLLSSSSTLASSHLAAPAGATSEAPEANSIYAPIGGEPLGVAVEEGTTPEARLRNWYAEALSELAVMARASVVNRLYEAPKLVVEGRGKVVEQASENVV